MSTVKTIRLDYKTINWRNYFETIGLILLFETKLVSKEPAIPIIKKLAPIITAKVIRNLKNVELNMIILYHFLKIVKYVYQ